MSVNKIFDLIKQFHNNTKVENIYGNPLKIDGVTLIPVAKVSFGGGGGGGFEKPSDEKFEKTQAFGGGGGAGFSMEPVGYIELINERTRFVPTEDKFTRMIKFLVPFVSAGVISYISFSSMICCNKKVENVEPLMHYPGEVPTHTHYEFSDELKREMGNPAISGEGLIFGGIGAFALIASVFAIQKLCNKNKK